MSEPQIAVELVLAGPESVWTRSIRLAAGATIAHALQASGFAAENPGYALGAVRVGIYGKECRLDHGLQDGDRVEIYRPLIFDAMESRRRRAAHRKALGKLKPGSPDEGETP